MTASGVFSEMQSALNVIWKTEAQAGTISRLVRARTASLGLVAALGFLLLVSLVVSTAIYSVGRLSRSGCPIWTRYRRDHQRDCFICSRRLYVCCDLQNLARQTSRMAQRDLRWNDYRVSIQCRKILNQLLSRYKRHWIYVWCGRSPSSLFFFGFTTPLSYFSSVRNSQRRTLTIITATDPQRSSVRPLYSRGQGAKFFSSY